LALLAHTEGSYDHRREQAKCYRATFRSASLVPRLNARSVAIRNFILSLPILRSRAVQRAYLVGKRRAARMRRRLAAHLGSQRLLKPSYHGLEARLDDLFSGPGVFVEAGANDGYTQSNTYWLERCRGWRGVLIEAIPELYRECMIERPDATVVNCALVADSTVDPWVTLRYRGLESRAIDASGQARGPEDGEWISLEEQYEIRVRGRTLSEVLDWHGIDDVDLLSLDVEGFEAPALRGLDLSRHAPRYIVVESPSEDRHELETVLGDRYEFRERLSPQDVLYARADA